MSVKKKPLVVVTRKLPDSIETRMRELFDARLNLDDVPMTAEQLAEAARTADVLVPTVTDEITAAMVNQPDCKLRLIAHFGNGIDNLDVAAAHARGITVTNTPKVLTEDTADMTMALILAVPRRMIEGAALLTDGGEWPGWSPTWMLGRRLGGKRLGIIGMGRIGQAVARRARAFGLQIHYHNRKPVAPRIADELGATYWDSLDQMLARMDIISVNCPHTPATFHLLSARRLKLVRKDAFIVNTARGEVIDEETLTKLIEAGDIAGAGLDVYEHEPAVNPKLVRLAKHGKVVLLPHMGSATIEGRVEMGEKVIINIRTFLDNHKPPDRVLPGML
ncbi:2-hydroxyacid dehydrogenase [Rhodopseudomonas palustris]|uniref:D-glycerate dehydrogenase n=1 Tax=Rhodopseudomonas palustris (strain ATCC BAA-98 / CGA009) TaxID=258594 RepID=Q6NCP7_RHOPA|nr:D-glycerate dehydrogenase [Rhodopseudomonas palustris]ACE98986.1 D-isomer specific 2-hydroxyacid dehydrogenase NAD-binding [Rhodopseudomonas palustris TIE-1]OPF93301.1 D-glycerate dehydrogenase [Rhodopseudomonas palustris]PPQ44735.1 D-glycerate dehydrogenase [Rhodopseudomonas palustris]QLH69635.1 D-glycerate dehydrogenase [Rhodopseudomonas palustris]QQM01921.1 Glycerate dehydrogenase [Rhodopseudomonas palustris]